MFSYDYNMIDNDLMNWLIEEGEEPYEEIKTDANTQALVDEIAGQIQDIRERGYEPFFVLLNKRNYSRLVSHSSVVKDIFKFDERGLVDEIFGCSVVLWDVPVDYVNVRAKSGTEFAFEGNLRGKQK